MIDIHICHQRGILTRWNLAIDTNTLYSNNGTNTLYLNNHLIIKVVQPIDIH